MFFIIHALLGSLIAERFSSVLLIIALSLISHFLLDMLPHWDGHYNKKLFRITDKVIFRKSTAVLQLTDLFLTLILIIILYFEFDSKLMILGALVSILPDLAKAGYFTKLRKRKAYIAYLKFHSKIQKDVSWKLGLLTQFIVLILLLKILF